LPRESFLTSRPLPCLLYILFFITNGFHVLSLTLFSPPFWVDLSIPSISVFLVFLVCATNSLLLFGSILLHFFVPSSFFGHSGFFFPSTSAVVLLTSLPFPILTFSGAMDLIFFTTLPQCRFHSSPVKGSSHKSLSLLNGAAPAPSFLNDAARSAEATREVGMFATSTRGSVRPGREPCVAEYEAKPPVFGGFLFLIPSLYCFVFSFQPLFYSCRRFYFFSLSLEFGLYFSTFK